MLTDEPGMALEAIYAQYGRKLAASLFAILGNDEDLVKDVISETLAVLWEKRREAAGKENPLAWMMRVASNIALYRLRQETRRKAAPLDRYINVADRIRADSDLGRRELEERILKAAEKLKPNERTVFLEIKLHGKTNKEVAMQEGMAEQTVKNLLSGALKKIRKALGDMLGILI